MMAIFNQPKKEKLRINIACKIQWENSLQLLDTMQVMDSFSEIFCAIFSIDMALARIYYFCDFIKDFLK